MGRRTSSPQARLPQPQSPPQFLCWVHPAAGSRKGMFSSTPWRQEYGQEVPGLYPLVTSPLEWLYFRMCSPNSRAVEATKVCLVISRQPAAPAADLTLWRVCWSVLLPSPCDILLPISQEVRCRGESCVTVGGHTGMWPIPRQESPDPSSAFILTDLLHSTLPAFLS